MHERESKEKPFVRERERNTEGGKRQLRTVHLRSTVEDVPTGTSKICNVGPTGHCLSTIHNHLTTWHLGLFFLLSIILSPLAQLHVDFIFDIPKTRYIQVKSPHIQPSISTLIRVLWDLMEHLIEWPEWPTKQVVQINRHMEDDQQDCLVDVRRSGQLFFCCYSFPLLLLIICV